MQELRKISAFIAVAAIPTLFAGCSSKQTVQAAPAAIPVIVAKVEQRDMPVEIHAIGNVDAYSTVQVKSLVGAQLEKAYFKEGEDVRKGQLLFTMDKRQIQADLAQAQGTLAKDEAQLDNAKANASRATQLLKDGVVSQQDYDAAVSNQGSLQAAVIADRAAVQNQKVQLSYTDIYAPISGRTGSLQIYPGNLVKANDTPFLVTINELQPIYVDFSLPEQQLELVKQFSKGHKLTVQARINGDPNPANGDLTFIDNAVDVTTGTIKLKATFANRNRRLWPGQFVDVVLTVETQKNALVVPSSAVLSGQAGQYVYIVKPDMTAENRSVLVARTQGQESVISSGLQPGETVVTDGQVRLQPGAKVQVKRGAAANASTINTDYSGE